MLMPDGLDDAARDELVARAEGNPLYLEELLRSLIEGGGLERQPPHLGAHRAPAARAPPALESLLVSRIDHLRGRAAPPRPDRRRRRALLPGAGARAASPAATTFERDLACSLRTQVVRELRRYPELEYTFKHGLLQEAALSTLTPARRQELYGRVAAVFEELYAGSREDYLEVLAHYYGRSKNLGKSMEYLRAGRRAGRRAQRGLPGGRALRPRAPGR